MAESIQSVRGMNDVLPDEARLWHCVEATLLDLLDRYAYDEIRLPLVEKTALFKRSVGEVTDIVEKEMYTFEDRNGDSLSLRPEGTAGCVRACIEHGLLYNQTQKLWYRGAMFRHERPQKGRTRQFYQIGVEAFGLQGPEVDAEQILLMARLWQALGLSDIITLEINTLGTSDSRARYREVLVQYFKQHGALLDEDSLRRLNTNPLRILDSKNPNLRAVIEAAPSLMDFLDEASRQHFEQLQVYLDAAGLVYRVNPRLVRGLDYYGRTVYEWVTTELGAQGTVCAGGRYDGLVELLGGQATPAVGFALGIERVVLLLQQHATALKPTHKPQIYIITVGEAAEKERLLFAEWLRDQCPDMCVTHSEGSASFKTQFKRADKSGADWAVILGDEEIAAGYVSLKHLRNDQIPQQRLSREASVEQLRIS